MSNMKFSYGSLTFLFAKYIKRTYKSLITPLKIMLDYIDVFFS